MQHQTVNDSVTPRAAYRVGMVVPPAWFNFCAEELHSLAPEDLTSMSTQLRFDEGFGYTLDEIRAAASEVRKCVNALAAAKLDYIIQIGTPFSTVHGWQGGCELEAALEESSGVPTEMMGLTVARAFNALGLKTATVSTVYYDADWTRQYVNFLTEAGIEVLYAGSFADQGVHRQVDILDTRHEIYEDVLERSVAKICDLAPNADAVIVSGMPCPMLALTPKLESTVGRPVVSYVAMYAAVLARLGLRPPANSGQVFEIGQRV